jgi:hypothetical protein
LAVIAGLSPAFCQPPCVTDVPMRRPTAGVTPPPTTTLAKRGGLALPNVRRARSGEVQVVGALADAGRWLGIALASTFNLLDVRAVVLGGCFGPLSPWLVEEVRRTLEERSLAARSGSYDVLPSAFGDGAAVRGAAALSLHRVLDEPWTVPSAELPDVRDRTSAPRAARREREVAIARR